jgi:DNA-binding transcriptional LysR family regulator
MLEIKPLIYFVAAFEQKSISKAAVRCFVAQPSISHSIKSLENKLKYPLFYRSKKGLNATSYGIRFYKQAKTLIQHMQRVEQTFIGTSEMHINVYFQGDVSLRTIHPVKDQMKEAGVVAWHRVSELNQSDIAFIDYERVGKNFEFIKLYQEGFSVLMAENHRLVTIKNLNLCDVAQADFIQRPYCSRSESFHKVLKELNIILKTTAEADNDLQVIELVALGFDLAAMPSKRIYQLPEGVVSKPIYLDFKREIVLAYRSSRLDIRKRINDINWNWLYQQLASI